MKIGSASASWNVVGLAVLAVTAIAARSVALGGFGLDSLIDIGASNVVIWELSGTDHRLTRRALLLIGVAFGLLAVELVLNQALDWWWADPMAGYVLVFCAVREVREIARSE